MPVTAEEIALLDAYWRAANYLSVGQIYLRDNALLKRPLKPEDIKPRLLGHFGTTPGLNFIYVHLNRIITARKARMMLVTGPGHGAPGILANTFLEGSYSEIYPNIQRDAEGVKLFFKQFSWPYGIPSHCAANVPGSINEGGELGYSLVHAYGAAFDNPGLVVPCIVGDGEAETGTLATSWHSNKFLNPVTDGTVLPILHLNGYKIANPTVLARIPHEELEQLMRGYGYTPYTAEGDDPATMHEQMATTLDRIFDHIAQLRDRAAKEERPQRPAWPMLILRSPKGWTGPEAVDGEPVEGTWRAHQVPLEEIRENPEHLELLEAWLRSYKPQQLFDDHGCPVESVLSLAPKGELRMSVSPQANGGKLLRSLSLPDFRDYAAPCSVPCAEKEISAMQVLGDFLRDVIRLNHHQRNFRMFGPDETASNRLQDVYQATDKQFEGSYLPTDEHMATDGRVLEVLSENLCQGWLEGYLLSGRHGFFSSYEAFIHIVDSMFNQHAKWLRACQDLPWREPIASLNYLLSSHVWRQDNNGFSHQDPGFIDHVANKQSQVTRIYFPPDANCLLSVADHCLRSRNYINLIIAGKQPAWTYLSMDEAVRHCADGLGIWHWASNCGPEGQPDVVIACAGDVPTMEALAAVTILREWAPGLKYRFVNVVDLFTLESPDHHPHGMDDEAFERIFTSDRPVVMAFHGYASVVHKLTYKRRNHGNFHVHGFRGEGTTTTPFDMTVLNQIDRYSLAFSAIRYSGTQEQQSRASQLHSEAIQRHRLYVSEHGEDLPDVRSWRWSETPS
jgi:xylulose-5-phosphate/fructose-6-phosphate phosphoketolase